MSALHYKTFVLSPEKDWVVFIHGAGGSSSIWYKQLRDFKEHFNLMLIDLRGHGRSSHLAFGSSAKANYTFKEIATEILEVLNDANIAKAHFIGISLGTIIIRSIGELEPNRVQSMILGGAITRLNVRSKVLIFSGHLVKRFIPYMWLYSLFAWIIMPRKRHKESRLMFINEAKKLCQKEFIKWFKLANEANPLLRYFKEKELPIPTLYLMGEEDHMFLPPVQTIVRRHHFSSLQIVHNSGHVCNVDQPELFNHYALNFLNAHRQNSVRSFENHQQQ